MDLDDQRIIRGIIDSAGNAVSGLNEHGLASNLWQLASQVRECAAAGHRYVRCTSCDAVPARHCALHHDS